MNSLDCGNLWTICLGVDILIPSPCLGFNANISLLKAITINSGPLWRAFIFSRINLFSAYLLSSWSSFDIKLWNILYQIALFLSVSHIVILSSKILQLNEFIVSYCWKSYMYLFVSYYWPFLSILPSNFLISSHSFLISLFSSSFEKFSSVSFGFADFLLVSKFKKL